MTIHKRLNVHCTHFDLCKPKVFFLHGSARQCKVFSPELYVMELLRPPERENFTSFIVFKTTKSSILVIVSDLVFFSFFKTTKSSVIVIVSDLVFFWTKSCAINRSLHSKFLFPMHSRKLPSYRPFLKGKLSFPLSSYVTLLLQYGDSARRPLTTLL